MPSVCGFIVKGYLRGSCFCTTVASRTLVFGDWLCNAQQAFLFEFLLDSLFSYDSMLTWKTGCASACSVSPGKSDRIWFHMVPIRGDAAAQLLLSAFTQHVFSLRFALPICEQHSAAAPTRAVTGPIS